MNPLSRGSGFVVLVAMLLGAASAQAQVEHIQESREGYTVEFRDSKMLGETLGTFDFTIRLMNPPRRVLLIRARSSFVPEMLKSVENM